MYNVDVVVCGWNTLYLCSCTFVCVLAHLCCMCGFVYVEHCRHSIARTLEGTLRFHGFHGETLAGCL